MDHLPMGVFYNFKTMMTKEFAVLTETDLYIVEKMLGRLLKEGEISNFKSKNEVPCIRNQICKY